MFGIDWTDLQLYHYLAFGGGGVAILALILYFVLPNGVRIPAGVLGTIAGLVAGLGIGVIGMARYGYQMPKQDEDPAGEAANAKDAPKAIPPKMGPGGGKGMMMPGMGKGGGGKGKGGGPPSDKVQLAALVVKLQQLTEKPLTLKLTDEQRATIREQLKDLAEPEELSNEDAKKRLDAILAAMKDDRPTLEAAGYQWPGAPPQLAATGQNPFKEGPARDRLQSLQERLAK